MVVAANTNIHMYTRSAPFLFMLRYMPLLTKIHIYIENRSSIDVKKRIMLVVKPNE